MSIEAQALLHKLLDRLERQPDRVRRLQLGVPETFVSAEARAAFGAVMQDAVEVDAVALEYGAREERHLLKKVYLILKKVYLKDAEALYRFIGRVPASLLAAQAAAELRARPEPASSGAARARGNRRVLAPGPSPLRVRTRGAGAGGGFSVGARRRLPARSPRP
jgi:hypothetical protein